MLNWAIYLILGLTGLGFWKPYPVLFMLAAGVSMFTGLEWYNYFMDNMGIAVSLGLITYSFVCLGYALKITIWREYDY